MKPLTLKAHFDGKHILLDEPFHLDPGTPLVVTVLSAPSDLERTELSQIATVSLANAYGDDEPEYTPADVKP